ncbi:MAG TPA: glycosyltransferase family 2 protein [Burkholderiales bacterium]|nr:glycosyltransferase family 2 protein [Burkholderiales bacterium]
MELPTRTPTLLAGTETALPLVSIVIPSYNHGRYLGAAIDSVLAQDYPRVELIVIDDGSTDNSPEVLAQYTGRVHWERQANQGQAATMNRGWLMSSGDILGFLSADDFLLPEVVSRSVRALQDDPGAALVYCDFNLVDPTSALVRRVRAPEATYFQMVTQFICAPGPGAFFRRSAFEKAGLWDLTLRQMGDYEYWLRLGMHGRLMRIPEVLAAFRVHPGSQTFGNAHRLLPEEPVDIIRRYFERPDVPDDIRAARNQALSTAYLISAQLHFRAGSYRRGLGALRRAFELKPGNLFSLRFTRIAFNAAFNRLGHRILWSVRGAASRSTGKGLGRGSGQK